ncbi:MAG: hypothetical protein Q9209_001273 [Squamulea sp. 1 TL-2023]
MDGNTSYHTADGFIILEKCSRTAPNGKPLGQDSELDILSTPTQEMGVILTSGSDEPEILNDTESGENCAQDLTWESDGESTLTLPPGWEQRRDKRGRYYFIDHNTRSTTWECPAESDEISLKHYRKIGTVDVTSLPEGWEQDVDPATKRPYYIDHKTRTTSWVRPVVGIKETFKPLPKGWERRGTHDGNNRLYYVNHNDKTTSWAFPGSSTERKEASPDPDLKQKFTSTDFTREKASHLTSLVYVPLQRLFARRYTMRLPTILSSFLTLLSSALATTLTLTLPSTLPPLSPSTRAHLTTLNLQFTTPLTLARTFRFTNLTTPGTYNLDVYCRDYDFEGAVVVVVGDKEGSQANGVEVYRRDARTGGRGTRMLETGEKGDKRVELRVKGVRGYYEERQGSGLAMVFGMPYLLENMDPEMKKEFEEQQKKSVVGNVAGGGNPLQSFDMAGWMAGQTSGGGAVTSGREEEDEKGGGGGQTKGKSRRRG